MMIFYIHIYTHFGSRIPLLLTCRQWHNIAIDYSTLWRHISWPMSGDDPFSVPCGSLDSLASMIGRVNGTFELSVSILTPEIDVTDEEIDCFHDNVGQNWLDQCTSLSISTPSHPQNNASTYIARKLFLYGNFHSLESLSCRNIPRSPLWRALELDLIAGIEASRTKVKELRIYGESIPDIKEPLFSRLTSLHLHSGHKYVQTIPSRAMTSLEHLSIHQYTLGPTYEAPHIGLRDLVAPQLHSLLLRGKFPRNDFFSDNLIRQITHLSLDSFTYVEQILNFPALLSLSLSFQPADILQRLRAEKLEELYIDAIAGQNGLFARHSTAMTPRILRLSVQEPYVLENAFKGPLEIHDTAYGTDIYEHCPIWSRLEELYLVFFDDVQKIPLSVLWALRGNETPFSSFPKLRCLTVQYSNLGGTETSQLVKQKQVDLLISIRNSRIAFGFPILTRLEVGWHYVSSEQSYRHGSWPEWWVTEWRDCLKQESRCTPM